MRTISTSDDPLVSIVRGVGLLFLRFDESGDQKPGSRVDGRGEESDDASVDECECWER